MLLDRLLVSRALRACATGAVAALLSLVILIAGGAAAGAGPSSP